ncbi:TonB-dependent siderophore receptor [uncultured Nitratireductor sp.]|uniref:TonB-dependent siderophore receptor n=1 Tax=uncultured Nitratireductor sp. TaxID=520953 RepID=UPI0025FF507F|nr:TonB-dependent siderophore receptor [uncultured Nitratireductor sp.]
MTIVSTSPDNRSVLDRRSLALLGCTSFAVLMPAGIFAQELENANDTTMLQPLVVESGDFLDAENDARSIVAGRTTGGSRMVTDILDTPASVSVITSKEIQDRGAQNVEEVLQYTPGVLTGFYGSDDRFDFYKIRGFDAHAYRDGLPLGRPFGGVREEAYAFERVEVLKGANSTVFGVSDPGGSVNYVTKRPRSERFGEAYVTGGSFERKEIGFDFGDNITADDTLSYRLTGKFKDSDAEYDYSRDDERFIMGGLTWRPTADTNVTVVFDHLSRDAVPGSGGHPVGSDFPRSRFFGEPDYNYRGTDRSTLSVMLDHHFGSGLTFGANARYSHAETDFGYAYISSTPTDGTTIAQRSFFGNDTTTENFVADAYLQYEASFDSIDSRTLVGVLYNDFVSDNDTFFGPAPTINWSDPTYKGAPASVPLYSSARTDQTTKAIYLQQELTIADRFIATFGLRNDWIDTERTNKLTSVTSVGDISEFTTRAALTYRITDELAAYVSYAESVVPASGLTVEPERGEQYELGVKYQPVAFPALFTASVYDLSKKNITVTDPITMLPSTIGEVRVRGVDLEAKAEFGNNWSLTAGYSYLDAEIVENGAGGNVGNRPQFVPEHMASVWVNYRLPESGMRGDMNFGLGARYTSSYFFDAANTMSTDSSIVFDASLSYAVKENTELVVNVSNLFDEKHVDYGGFGADFYNPGRAISATLRHSW